MSASNNQLALLCGHVADCTDCCTEYCADLLMASGPGPSPFRMDCSWAKEGAPPARGCALSSTMEMRRSLPICRGRGRWWFHSLIMAAHRCGL